MFKNCQNCKQKCSMIQKYELLIKLLKTKNKLASKSILKQNAHDLLVQNTSASSLSQEFNIQQAQSKLHQNKQSNTDVGKMYSSYNLSLLILNNKPKKALLKQTFNLLKQFSFGQKYIKTNQQQMVKRNQFQNDNNKQIIIQQTFNYGKRSKKQLNINLSNIKELHNKIFSLQLENQKSQLIINKQKQQLQHIQKRFLKQTQKKQQSLQIISEQLSQKTDKIIQLQHIIKKYQKIIGKKSKNPTQNVLIEDEQELIKTTLRLQNINQKLNHDLRLSNEKILQLDQEIQILQNQNKKLKQQNNQLKQKNFQILAQQNKNQQLNEIYTNLSQKLNKKIQGLKKYEKQINISNTKSHKCLTILSSADTAVSKNNQNQQNQQLLPLSMGLSSREFNNQQKIQQIFSFLFNIQNQQHKITNESYFDEDQLTLLKNHKLTFLNNLKATQIPALKMKSQKIFRKNDTTETDQVFYIKSKQSNHNNSFFNALQEDQIEIKRKTNTNKINNMKLIQMQIDKNNLIQKISQLKNLNLHIRNVILNLLKSIDLSNSNQQCGKILELIFQLFQYSEEEKLTIFKGKKSKKFWGLI